MRVFLSWSGERSKQAAEVLSQQLKLMLQSLDPWHSEQIASGTRWSGEIAEQLSAINYGLILVTHDNQEAPWLLFEAGALAKSVSDARVVPILIDLEHKSDLIGPLSQFQARLATNESDMWELGRDINLATPEALDESVAKKTFEAFWPDTVRRLQQIRETGSTIKASPTRSSEDMMQEMVERLREHSVSFQALDRIERHLVGLSTTSVQNVKVYPATGNDTRIEADFARESRIHRALSEVLRDIANIAINEDHELRIDMLGGRAVILKIDPQTRAAVGRILRTHHYKYAILATSKGVPVMQIFSDGLVQPISSPMRHRHNQ